MKNTIYAGITSLALSLGGLFGCSSPELIAFNDIIGEEQVVYSNCDGTLCIYNTLQIYDLEGNLKTEIKEGNENLTIGDSCFDKYIVYDENGDKTIYAKNFVNKNGVRFDSKGDPVEAKAIEISQKRLEEATVMYQDYLGKINLKLEEQL